MEISRRFALAALGGAALFATRGLAQTTEAPAADAAAPVVHEVKMLNKATDDPKKIMVFEPDLVRAKPGDTVRFIPTDKSHSANSMKEMIPATAEPLKTKVNEEHDYVVTVDGAYGVQCTPHVGMGMVMVILTGEIGTTLDVLKAHKLKGPAKKRFDEILVRADELLAAEAAAG